MICIRIVTWLRHMKKRCMDVLMWRYERLDMNNFRRDRGRLKTYWEEMIRHDMMLF